MNTRGAVPAIHVRSLTKSFGGRAVIRNLDLVLPQGGSLAIVGHNGSGKTTLIRLLSGLARADAGLIHIFGVRQGLNAIAVHRAIGIVSHNTFLYQDLTPVENLQFYGRLYGVDRLHQRVETLVERFGLAGYRSTLVRMLSRGTQQRLSLARALLPDPRIVLLDEPDSGLDPQGVDMLPQLLELAELEGRTTLLTTHNLKLGLVLAQRIAILAQGRLVWEHGTPGLSEADVRAAYDLHLPKSNRIWGSPSASGATA